MALIKKRVIIRTNVAIQDTDGFPKTDLYYDGYNQLADSVKGYKKYEDEEGKEVYNEVIEIDNNKVVNVLEY